MKVFSYGLVDYGGRQFPGEPLDARRTRNAEDIACLASRHVREGKWCEVSLRLAGFSALLRGVQVGDQRPGIPIDTPVFVLTVPGMDSAMVLAGVDFNPESMAQWLVALHLARAFMRTWVLKSYVFKDYSS